MKYVCASCFDDQDLRTWIREHNGPRGCCVCKRRDAPTAPLDHVLDRIVERVKIYYGTAVNQMYYNSREGGYQGDHWDAYDMMHMIGLDFPRDDDNMLHNKVVGALSIDEPWCARDLGSLNLDDALRGSWQSFCNTIKHRRRFFFHATGEDNGYESWTPQSLLAQIAGHCQETGLLDTIPLDTELWRARPDLKEGTPYGPGAYGPPPAERALQSNRMNPPGIPILYVASSIRTALREARAGAARVGLWRAVTPLRILDLRTLPEIPGLFSEAIPNIRYALRFLHSFAKDIMTEVERDDRNHVDYLPSQVVTEFMRDYKFENGPIDGIAYPSTKDCDGWNIALFFGPEELGLDDSDAGWNTPKQRLTFECDQWSVLP